jgi:hypothetical protein
MGTGIRESPELQKFIGDRNSAGLEDKTKRETLDKNSRVSPECGNGSLLNMVHLFDKQQNDPCLTADKGLF